MTRRMALTTALPASETPGVDEACPHHNLATPAGGERDSGNRDDSGCDPATATTPVAIGWTNWSSPSQDSSVSVKRVRQRLNPCPPSAPYLLRRSELPTRCFPSNLRRLAPDLRSFVPSL